MVQVLLAMFGHVLAIAALFAMFGSVIDEFESTPYKMTMFDLTFGKNIGGELYYKTNTGMVFIFLSIKEEWDYWTESRSSGLRTWSPFS